jgi:hypothetical protein
MVAKEDKVLVVSRVRLEQMVLQAHKAQLVIAVLKEIQGSKVRLELRGNRVSKEKRERQVLQDTVGHKEKLVTLVPKVYRARLVPGV